MSVLSTGTGALIAAFQRALGTVSHNVANVNTEGYSRQRVEFATRNPTDYGYGFVGNGVKITDIQRIADQLATSRLLDSSGELARLQQLSGLSNRVDALFSDTATNVAGLWSNFFDSVGALSSNAAGTAEREDMLAQGNALATRFRQLDGQLRALDAEVNNGLLAGTQGDQPPGDRGRADQRHHRRQPRQRLVGPARPPRPAGQRAGRLHRRHRGEPGRRHAQRVHRRRPAAGGGQQGLHPRHCRRSLPPRAAAAGAEQPGARPWPWTSAPSAGAWAAWPNSAPPCSIRHGPSSAASR